MGRNSGNVQGGGLDKDSSFKGKIKNVGSLIEMKDPQMYKATGQAISRFHSVLGVRERNVKLADFKGAYGVQVTSAGKSEAVYLNRAFFNKGKAGVVGDMKKNYKQGWLTSTNKPVAHIVTHELAHALWNRDLSGANQKAAGKEITKLYNQWKRAKSKSGYGKYSSYNVDEWFAETATKAVHGKKDKYTDGIKSIVKKYKL